MIGRLPRRNIAGAALLLMAAYVLSRFMGLARDVAIGYQFGTGPEYEAYLAGIRIPDLIFQVMAGGAVASAFIPVFTRYIARDDEEDGWRLVSALFNLTLIVLVPIVVLLIMFVPYIMPLLTPEWQPQKQAMATTMARIMMVAPIFFALGCFTTSVLNSYQRFFLAALAPTAYNVGIITGALVFSPTFEEAGLIRGYGLALGATLGSVLFLLVQLPGLVQVGMAYRRVLDLAHAGVREVGRLMVPRALGLGAYQLNLLVVLYFASGVSGGYAALNYALLLSNLPLGIFAFTISSAAFPALAEHVAADRRDQMKATLARSFRSILYLTVPASVGIIVLREPIVRLLFERGAFTETSTAATAYAVQFYAISLAAQASTEIMARAFYAMADTRTPVLVAGAAIAANLALCWALVGPLQQGGLALALSIAAIGEGTALFVLLRRRLAGFGDGRLAVHLAKISGAALLMGVALWLVLLLLPLGAASGLLLLALVALSIGLGAAVYLLLTVARGCEEPTLLARAVRL